MQSCLRLALAEVGHPAAAAARTARGLLAAAVALGGLCRLGLGALRLAVASRVVAVGALAAVMRQVPETQSMAQSSCFSRDEMVPIYPQDDGMTATFRLKIYKNY